MSGFSVRRDQESAPFFDAAAEHRLLIKQCPVCSRMHPPQARRCDDSDHLDWVEASGNAVLVTWAIDHSPALDPVLESPDSVHTVFGIVELAEGPWLQVPIVDSDPSFLAEGIPMTVRFARPGGGEQIPVFASS
jgi:uncharacterized protein